MRRPLWGRGVETELVIRAQRGDRAAFGLVAAEIATRFLDVSRRILRDIDLAEDASQQALVAIWRDLPRLRDPARFDAWSYRVLVRACYSEGRRSRVWSPNIRVLPVDERAEFGGFDAVIYRDQLERAIHRLSVDHRTVLVLHHYADIPVDRVAESARRSRSARSPLDSICDARSAGGTRCRRAVDGTRCRRALSGTGGSQWRTSRHHPHAIVLSWLHEDAHENAEPYLLRALDEVDTTPQRRPWWPARRTTE